MYNRKLTTRQVEIMTGVPHSTIGRIVNHQTIPRLDTLEQIAKGLHVKVSDLYESDFQ